MPRSRASLPVLGAGLTALMALAVWRLDRTSLWVDEVFSLAATNKLGLSLRSTKGTMGLYYLALWCWARVGNAAWWLRAFSTLGAAASLVLLARIGRRVTPGRISLAPLIVVGIPIFAWTATEARSYSWETALTCAAWLALLGALDASDPLKERRNWSMVTALCFAGPFVHGLYFVQLPGMLACVLLAGRSAPERARLARRFVPALAAAIVPTGVIAALGGSRMGSTWGTTPEQLLRHFWTWFLAPTEWVAVVLGLLVTCAALVALNRARHCDDPLHRAQTLVPVLWGLGATLTMFTLATAHHTFAPYYLAPAAPGIALLLSDGTVIPGAWLARRAHVKAVGPAVAAAVILLVAATAVQHPISLDENWRGAAKVIAARARPGDAIVFASDPSGRTGTGSTRLGFEASWREMHPRPSLRVLSHPRPLGLPQRSEPAMSASEVTGAWLRYPRVWVVDYQDVFDGSGVVTDQIRENYCPTFSATFFPSISVTLYVTRSRGCPPAPASGS